MKAQEIKEKLEKQAVGDDVEHFGLTTYVIRTGVTEWSVCDNGEEVVCHSLDEAARIVQENLA